MVARIGAVLTTRALPRVRYKAVRPPLLRQHLRHALIRAILTSHNMNRIIRKMPRVRKSVTKLWHTRQARGTMVARIGAVFTTRALPRVRYKAVRPQLLRQHLQHVLIRAILTSRNMVRIIRKMQRVRKSVTKLWHTRQARGTMVARIGAVLTTRALPRVRYKA